MTVRSETDVGRLKARIARHYDELSPLYRDLWGSHIHHGYWKVGTETKEEAQEQLITEFAARAKVECGEGRVSLEDPCLRHHRCGTILMTPPSSILPRRAS